MKAAINAKGANGPTLEIRNVPDPTPGKNDLLVAVKAIGLNRADLSRAIGNPDNPDANIAGMEVAGEVISVGADVKGFAPGDRVMSMTTRAYAEKALVDYRAGFRMPKHLSFVEGAALPVFISTGHDALVSNGELKKGDSVLITGVTAGVGTTMIQIAKTLGASLVAGTSRDASKLTRLKDVGLDLAIVAGKDNLAEACMAATGKKGIDVAADNVGAGMLNDLMDAAAVKGRIVSIGRLGGKADQIDLDKIALKRLKLIGVTFRTRSPEEKFEITRRAWADLGSAIASGQFKPIVDRTFTLDEALAAQDYMRRNTHIGKIVLNV
ncbi:zinc-binding dehydrogenase [Roseiarcaceae bacterium H3SJ34-1]|uniref:zinc-binding dehydrogenase n=1 Tax=Terripilifer ovatus TaxID=3032367 RepID=UPI003AB966B8|nr:zinc-binding dehydrogenase [Roseiarcaceae bacterium H3SJ34-1]